MKLARETGETGPATSASGNAPTGDRGRMTTHRIVAADTGHVSRQSLVRWHGGASSKEGSKDRHVKEKLAEEASRSKRVTGMQDAPTARTPIRRRP